MSSWTMLDIDEVCCLWARFGEKALEFARERWHEGEMAEGRKLLEAFAKDYEQDKAAIRKLIETALEDDRVMDGLTRRFVAILVMIEAREMRSEPFEAEAEA